MPDLLIVDTGDGGEAVSYAGTDNADLRTDNGLTTSIYVSLFTGPAWYDSIAPVDQRVTGAGDFEFELSQAITLSQLGKISRAAKTCLRWLEDTRVCESVGVEIRNPAVGRIEILVTCTQPAEDATIYRFVWSQPDHAVIEEIRNG